MRWNTIKSNQMFDSIFNSTFPTISFCNPSLSLLLLEKKNIINITEIHIHFRSDPIGKANPSNPWVRRRGRINPRTEDITEPKYQLSRMTNSFFITRRRMIDRGLHGQDKFKFNHLSGSGGRSPDVRSHALQWLRIQGVYKRMGG